MNSAEWDIKIGDPLTQAERIRRFGGSEQDTIASSAQTPNVFIYFDPSAGAEFAYTNQWDASGDIFYYTGDGAVGDQTFANPGNAAIRHHKKAGKALRLFEAAGTKSGAIEVTPRYVGRVELDNTEPYSIQRARDSLGNERDIIIFKLRRVPEDAPGQQRSGISGPNLAAEAADQDRLLSQLRAIRVDVHEGRKVPYKYVVLLWAISQALRTGQRRFHYRDISSEVAAYLKPFQMSTSRPDPRNPWFALKESPLWWDLVLPNTAGLTYKQVRELNLEGGLSARAFTLLVGADDFAARAVRTIVELIGDSPTVRTLLSDLNLDQIATSTPQAAVAQDRGDTPTIRKIPVENHLTEDFAAEYKALSRQDRTHKEAKLQRLYENYLKNTLHHAVSRHEICIDGQVLYTDLYDETSDDLIEVKSSTERNSMRLALGQLLDYAQSVKPTSCTVLVPEKPTRGILDLYETYGVRIVWRDGDSFKSSDRS